MEVEVIKNSKKEEKKGSGTGAETETEERNREQKLEKEENQEQYRVVINKESSEILEQMRLKVVNGFDSVTVTKSHVANWLILKYLDLFSEVDTESLRERHFDDRKLLASILKEAKVDNDLPENLKRAIREHYGLGLASPKSKPKKLIKSA